MDTLKKIIGYERQAQDIYGEALAYRDGMPELIKKETALLAENMGRRAEKKLGDAVMSEEKFLKESEVKIAEKTSKDKERIDAVCREKKEEWIRSIFERLTGFEELGAAKKE